MILRICVVIPAYNNTGTISDVVKDVVLKTRFPVLIVDDGSLTPVTDSLYSWDVKKAIGAGRVRIVRFAKHQGKGAALQFAIRDLVQQGFTHMLTVDADGQYLASEIAKLVTLTKQNPWELVIGQRCLPQAHWWTRASRWFSNFWVSYQTGMALHDSESSFRLYPLFAVQNTRYFTSRFDWELEALVRLLWNGTGVHETEVEVAKPGGERVSHFHKIWDNARLAVLLFALALTTLIKGHRGTSRLAVAIGLGVFIGASPWLTWQLAAVVILGLVLRLNGVAMALGTLVSSPPLISFTMLASIYIGQQWLGIAPLAGVSPHFSAWLAGSLVFGLLAGTALGLTSFFVLRALGRSQAWTVIREAWRGLNSFYRRVQPDVGFWRRQRDVLFHIVGALRLRMTAVKRPKVQGHEALNAELQKSSRVNLLTAHLGGFTEIARQAGLSSHAVVVWRAEARTNAHVEMIRFFGKLAPFDCGAFEAAVSTGVPLAFAFAGEGKNGFELLLREPKTYKYATHLPPALQTYAWMEKFTRELEAYLLQNPRAWFNFYDFWMSVPAAGRTATALLEEIPLPSELDAGWTSDERISLQP